VALTDLQPGDILQWNQLDRHGGLKPDMRAVSIAVDMVTSAGGNLGVGKRVDVLASYEQDEGGGRKIPRTILLLSDVEVLAVYSPPLSFGTRPLPGETPTPNTLTNVTLSVSLRDAMRLTWMSNFAKEVRLVVRRTDEKAPLPSIPPVDQSTFK
jgi:Flp pilus assembly protein CpaB